MREIRLTNTMSGKKEVLQTRELGKLAMYSCGPTVYNFIHIGNLRAALVPDMLFRYFKRVGYDVTYVRNFTDVDDKIIQKSVEEKIPASQVAGKYTVEVEKDYAVAGLLAPTHKTKVTEHIPEIIAMIEKIVQNGKGYVVDGEVFFSIQDFPTYGKLSHKPLDDLIAGARVEVNTQKKNPLDFSLWKPAKPGEPFWESPWGKGRPGWHIECSAMATRWLGPQIDVHHGGEDLVFPHHENEIAQTEASSGKEPYVRYWVHNAFLNFSGEKMSKSLGNVWLARDFLARFGGEFARYVLLSAHYRSLIDVNEELIENGLSSLHRIYEAKLNASKLLKGARARSDLRAEGAWGQFLASCEVARKEIDDHFANDFNTPGALAALFTLVREFNRTLAEPLASATPSAVLGASEFIKVIEEDIGGILGIGLHSPERGLEIQASIRASRASPSGIAKPSREEIEQKIQERLSARAAKDFSKADLIRKDLEGMGVILKDGPTGTTWEYR